MTIPNSQAVNRGSHDVKSMIQACKATDVGLIAFIRDKFGEVIGYGYCVLE